MYRQNSRCHYFKFVHNTRKYYAKFNDLIVLKQFVNYLWFIKVFIIHCFQLRTTCLFYFGSLFLCGLANGKMFFVCQLYSRMRWGRVSFTMQFHDFLFQTIPSQIVKQVTHPPPWDVTWTDPIPTKNTQNNLH